MVQIVLYPNKEAARIHRRCACQGSPFPQWGENPCGPVGPRGLARKGRASLHGEKHGLQPCYSAHGSGMIRPNGMSFVSAISLKLTRSGQLGPVKDLIRDSQRKIPPVAPLASSLDADYPYQEATSFHWCGLGWSSSGLGNDWSPKRERERPNS